MLFFGMLLVVNLFSANSFRFTTLEWRPPLRMPWGEELQMYSGRMSLLNAVTRVVVLMIFLWTLWRASVLYRRGERRAAVLLSIHMAIQFVGVMWGWLIDAGILRSFYIAPLGYLSIGLLMSPSMTLDLHEQEERAALAAADWRETFDSVRTPIMVLDAKGRVMRANRAARELTGYGQTASFAGAGIAALGDGEPWQTATELVEHIAEERGATSAETKDAQGRTWDLNVAHFATDTGRGRFILVLWDISGIVELQQSLRRSERLSAMGAIVSGVAHEVRNPLFGISATIDAYADELSGPETVECVAALRGEVGRLKRLMQDLLEYGKPAALTIEEASVAEIVELAITGRCTRVSPVPVVTDIPSTLPRLRIDGGRMRQVFENLVDNAAQHSPPGGVVRIDARAIEHAGRSWIECRVADAGPGFSAADIDHLFEPFYSRRPGGTGLGMSIVQRIVEDHDGNVSASNGPNGGAVVRVRLPIGSAF